MTYKFDDGQIGYPPIELVVPVPTNLPSWSPGFIAVAEDVVWGPGEFIFARASAGIRLYGLCLLTPTWDATNRVVQQNMAECTNTANLGRPVYVYQGNTALTTGQYGWFMRSGMTPVNGSATVAAGTVVGITAAGQVGANTAGKEILSAVSAIAATQTVVTPGTGKIADTIIKLANTQGFFPGAYVSGTGVGAAAIVSSVGNGFITVTVMNSAAVTGNVTATYNNATIFYNVLAMNCASAQGAIT